MNLSDEVLQILREHDFPITRKEIFALAKGAETADEVSRSLNYLNKRGLVAKMAHDASGISTWCIAAAVVEKPIGQQLKEALQAKHAPAPKPILQPISKATPTGKLGYSMHDGGALTIYLNDGMSDRLELDANETLALGDFLHLTQVLWRP